VSLGPGADSPAPSGSTRASCPRTSSRSCARHVAKAWPGILATGRLNVCSAAGPRSPHPSRGTGRRARHPAARPAERTSRPRTAAVHPDQRARVGSVPPGVGEHVARGLRHVGGQLTAAVARSAAPPPIVAAGGDSRPTPACIRLNLVKRCYFAAPDTEDWGQLRRRAASARDSFTSASRPGSGCTRASGRYQERGADVGWPDRHERYVAEDVVSLGRVGN